MPLKPLPSVRDELNRKCWDALQELLKAHQAGKVSQDSLRVAVDTLWTAISGLAERDLQDFMDELSKGIEA